MLKLDNKLIGIEVVILSSSHVNAMGLRAVIQVISSGKFEMFYGNQTYGLFAPNELRFANKLDERNYRRTVNI